MSTTKKYWKGIEELTETSSFIEGRDKEFAHSMSVEEFLADENLNETSTGRRDFLKFLGFSVAAATIVACEAPVTKAIPYVIKPENVTPGMPTWYASTYYDGVSYASVLVKTREGRPIYIKGNKDFGLTNGNVNPQILASVLSLYDSARLKSPFKGNLPSTWKDVDGEIMRSLKEIAASNGNVVFLTNSIISTSTQAAINEIKNLVSSKDDSKNFKHIQYDAVSYAGIRNANKLSFGDDFIPSYDFEKAKTIVSISADFLSTWLMSNVYAAQYATRRNPDGDWMSKHFQFESILSITGSNADYRAMIKPSEEANVLSYLLKKFGVSTSVSSSLNPSVSKIADAAFESLKQSKGNSLIVSGSNNTGVQILVNKLNTILGSYNYTINTNDSLNLFKSQDTDLANFVKEATNGNLPSAIFFMGVNPVYSLSNGEEFAKALKKIKLSVSFSSHADETASKCTFICPDHNAFESWNDFSPVKNHIALAQPTIRPLFDTAAVQESLLVWTGKAKRGGKDSTVVYDYIKSIWNSDESIFSSQDKFTDFDLFWNKAIHDSCIDLSNAKGDSVLNFNSSSLNKLGTLPKSGALEVVLYQKTGIRSGIHANNPWLQELPDPISKVTWDNYITMNPSEMKKGNYVTTFDQENGLNLAEVSVNGIKVTLPVYPSPGQAIGTIGIALGYGRGSNNEEIGNAAYQTKEYGGHVTDEKGNRVPIGKNVFSFTHFENGTISYNTIGKIKKLDGIYPIAATQIHHTVMGRYSIVRETSIETYSSGDKNSFNPSHTLETHEGPVEGSKMDLWEAHPVEHIGHRWGMTIDLSSCIGCGSCLIACQSENNVPVVGKDEVRRGREMHWLRIDRYFASDEEAAVGFRKNKETFDFDKAEIAAENPKVVHMPMLCHHCNHAPCETVCPVSATTHSNEGLNQMAYNRCIGTRYCANNCPYKVRRFNWFNYPSYKKFTNVNPAQDDLGRMVLNPDVTVRTRGVMEKCSFCVQKIQAGKLVAKKEARPVKDGDVVTACAEVCPTNAITVGDWNDIHSAVRKSSQEKRAYQALEEVGIKPNIWYKVKVRNEENLILDKLQKSSVDIHNEAHTEKKAHH